MKTKIKQTHFVKKLKDGNFILEDRPDLVLTSKEFTRLQRLIHAETELVHMYVIFCDYSKID